MAFVKTMKYLLNISIPVLIDIIAYITLSHEYH